MASMRSLLRTIGVMAFLLLVTTLAFQPAIAQSPTISLQNATKLAVKRSLEPQQEVHALGWMVDKKTLLVYGSLDNTSGIWLYDVADPQPRPRFLEGLAGLFSPNGSLWASVKAQGTGPEDVVLDLVDVQTGKRRTLLVGRPDLAFSPDSTVLATGEFGLKLWETRTGKQILNIPFEQTGVVTNLDFSPDGKLLATGEVVGKAHLWDVSTGQKKAELSGHSNNVSVQFSPNGTYLLTTSFSGSSAIWDVKTAKQLDLLYTADISVSQFSSDSSYVVVNDVAPTAEMVSELRVWDFKNKRERATFRLPDKGDGSTGTGYSAFSPNGKTLAFWTRNENILLIDPIAGKLLHTLKGHSHNVEYAQHSPDGKLLVSWQQDGLIILWDAAKGKKIVDLKGKPLKDVIFSPDGTMLITAHEDGTLNIWGV